MKLRLTLLLLAVLAPGVACRSRPVDADAGTPKGGAATGTAAAPAAEAAASPPPAAADGDDPVGPCLPGGGSAAELVGAAEKALAEDRNGAALGCAGEALAADPENPAVLLVAAESHLARSGDRESLARGRDLALRGAALAASGPRRDPSRLPRLLLAAGRAENDLGHRREALSLLEEAVAGDPRNPDAQYELGVALYELCRFSPARRAFERVRRHAPRDPWALHHLGLLAERAGEERRARELLARATRIAPRDFPPPVEMSGPAFEAELRRAVAALPEEERRALSGVPVGVEEIPDLADLVAVEPPLSPSILGLFRGPSLGEPCPGGEAPGCRSIVLYRRNLLRYARDPAQLSEQVRVTLLHELGHLHGATDEELRERGLE